MEETQPQAKSSRLGRRSLYYAVAALLVMVVLKAGAPEALCRLADGFTRTMTQVDPWFVFNTFAVKYDRLKAESLARCADEGTCGGTFSCSPTWPA